MWLGLLGFLVKLLLYFTQGSVKGDRTIASIGRRSHHQQCI
ncbi:hypothetical protein [Nodularia spumigena]|nr:hypothetical protein [Nodularia spumigena]